MACHTYSVLHCKGAESRHDKGGSHLVLSLVLVCGLDLTLYLEEWGAWDFVIREVGKPRESGAVVMVLWHCLLRHALFSKLFVAARDILG